VEAPRGLEVGVGEAAVLIGRQGDHTLTIDEQAEILGTINYEVACGYGERLHHLYVGRM